MSPLSEALKLARGGVPSFPCRSDKRPSCTRGFKDATADPAVLRRLWRQCPGTLVGVPTGSVSGFDVLDVDDARHSEAAEWVEKYKSKLPPTRVHETRSGGRHILFRAHESLRNTAGRIALGIDTRASGGYIIHWPSAGCRVLSDAPIAPWPAWLLTLLAPPPPTIRARGLANIKLSRSAMTRRVAGLLRIVASAPDGKQNNTLYWAGCRAAEMADPEAVGRLIVEAAVSAGMNRTRSASAVRNGLRRGGASS